MPERPSWAFLGHMESIGHGIIILGIMLALRGMWDRLTPRGLGLARGASERTRVRPLDQERAPGHHAEEDEREPARRAWASAEDSRNPGDLDTAQRLDARALAIVTCLQAAEDYADEEPELVAGLRERLRAWGGAGEAEVREGWAVYRQLGRLRAVVGHPLLRDPEAAVLQALV